MSNHGRRRECQHIQHHWRTGELRNRLHHRWHDHLPGRCDGPRAGERRSITHGPGGRGEFCNAGSSRNDLRCDRPNQPHPVELHDHRRSGGVSGANIDSISVSREPGTESILYSFAGPPTDGSIPASLIQGFDGNLYGVTGEGGRRNQLVRIRHRLQDHP